MGIVTFPEYAVPNGAQPLTHARILHANAWGAGGTATASTTATDFFADGPLNSLTYEKWKPTAAPATWERDYGAALADVDCVCIGAHTLGTSGATCLIEYEGASRTNELTHSNQVDNAAWTKSGATISANALRAPDDLVTMDEIIEDTSTGAHSVRQEITDDSSLVWTASQFFRPSGRSKGRLRLQDVTNGVRADADFDLIAQTVTLTTVGTVGGDMAATIEKVRDDIDIWRVSVGGTLNTGGGAGATIRIQTYLRNAAGDVIYTGDGASALGVWGAQLEQGALTPLVASGGTPASSSWYAVTPWFFPADDMPVMALFTPVSAQSWRLNVTAYDSAPEMAVFAAGTALQMQRPIYGGHAPIDLARAPSWRANVSETGEVLGRTLQRTHMETAFAWQHLTAAWVRDNWRPFMKAAETEPYFIAWRPATWSEVALCYAGSMAPPVNMGITDLMEVSIRARARGYD